MDLKISLKQFTPKNVFIRNGTKCYYDPYRQMLIPLTPETLLLYKMESYVHKVMGVPKHMMSMSQSFRKYGVDSARVIDIVIQDVIDGEIKPIGIVECKSSTLSLYNTNTSHIEELAKKADINYLVVTNGRDVNSFISRKDRLSFWKIDNIPNYETICTSHKEALAADFAALPPGTKVKTPVKKEVKNLKFNSKTTPKELQPAVMSLVKSLNDQKNKIKPAVAEGISIVADLGHRKKNISFGTDNLPKVQLRSFLIKDFYNNHQIVSFDLTPNDAGAPILSVTLDDYQNRQIIYTIDLNTSLTQTPKGYALKFDFAAVLSKETADLKTDVWEMVKAKAPHLIDGKVIHFGCFDTLDTIRLDHELTGEVFAHMTQFALILDEYREQVKRASKVVKKPTK